MKKATCKLVILLLFLVQATGCTTLFKFHYQDFHFHRPTLQNSFFVIVTRPGIISMHDEKLAESLRNMILTNGYNADFIIDNDMLVKSDYEEIYKQYDCLIEIQIADLKTEMGNDLTYRASYPNEIIVHLYDTTTGDELWLGRMKGYIGAMVIDFRTNKMVNVIFSRLAQIGYISKFRPV